MYTVDISLKRMTITMFIETDLTQYLEQLFDLISWQSCRRCSTRK